MGLFGAWQAEQRAGRWYVIAAEYEPDHDLRTWVARARGPSLGAFVYDSDFAYVVASGGGASEIAELVVNPDAADSYDLGIDVGLDEVADAFVRWSKKFAPVAASIDSVRKILAEEYVYAEEGLARIFASIGLDLPDPPPARERTFHRPVDDATRLIGPRVFAHFSASGAGVGAALRAKTAQGEMFFVVRSCPRVHGEESTPQVDAVATLMGITEWQRVPVEVPQTLGETAAWIRARLGLNE